MRETSRRGFLKIGGFCALGLALLPLADVLGKSEASTVSGKSRAPVGKKWAMVIDTKKCWEQGGNGCRDCIVACHSAHNVPDIPNPKEEIKWIWTESYENAFPGQGHDYVEDNLKGRPFTVLCNHCVNPPCVRVCPTQATYKRADGITMMDYHRCIGCRYCMAACPYGARSFNFRDPRPFIQKANPAFPTREKGVVEKCNFCAERLSAGSPPACVEACKYGALIFGDLEDPESKVRKILRSSYAIRRRPEIGTEPKVYYLI